MADAINRLSVPFALAAGSNLALVREQFLEPMHRFGFRGEFDAFVCNGATRYRCTYADDFRVQIVREFSFRDHLGADRYQRLLDVLRSTLEHPRFRLPQSLPLMGEQITDRGSMLNFAPVGRPGERAVDEAGFRNRDAFVAFDAKAGYRSEMLLHLRKELQPIMQETGLAIALGGQTSFDIVVKGNDKTYPVRTLLQEGHSNVIYFGDALFEGGNDEAVLHLIAEWGAGKCPVSAVAVAHCAETKSRLQELGFLSNSSP
jgi:hydroxymethylpyrimidine pyrophosphatase-like HAD family hydrolase